MAPALLGPRHLQMEGRAGRREIDRSLGGSVKVQSTPNQLVLTSGSRSHDVPRAVLFGLLRARPRRLTLVASANGTSVPASSSPVRELTGRPTGEVHCDGCTEPARTARLGPPDLGSDSRTRHRTFDPQPERLMTAPSVTESTPRVAHDRNKVKNRVFLPLRERVETRRNGV